MLVAIEFDCIILKYIEKKLRSKEKNSYLVKEKFTNSEKMFNFPQFPYEKCNNSCKFYTFNETRRNN